MESGYGKMLEGGGFVEGYNFDAKGQILVHFMQQGYHFRFSILDKRVCICCERLEAYALIGCFEEDNK